jgi:hypothetical protein
MARITPKTNWGANDIPVAPDFNRIENNNEQAFTELDVLQSGLTNEINTRSSADILLQNNINAENSARISGDNALDLSKISKTSLGSRLLQSVSVPVSSSVVVPEGYGFISLSALIEIEIRNSLGTWVSLPGVSGFVISDGSNLRVKNTSSSFTGTYTMIRVS